MDMPAQDDGDVFEATVFLSHFRDLPDGCQPGKVIYTLDKVLLLALLATLAGAEAFTDIGRFGEKKLSLLYQAPKVPTHLPPVPLGLKVRFALPDQTIPGAGDPNGQRGEHYTDGPRCGGAAASGATDIQPVASPTGVGHCDDPGRRVTA